jgi:hypothetical protein
MYFLNAPRTLCHIIEDLRTGKAPDPCGAKAHKIELRRYQKGEPNKLLKVKPQDIPLCKHCQRSAAWA